MSPAMLSLMAVKESAAHCCDEDHVQENLFFTMVEIMEAASNGKEYYGINFYSECIGKMITSISVLGKRSFFHVNQDGSTIIPNDIIFDCQGSLLIVTKGINLYINCHIFAGETANLANDLFGKGVIGHRIVSVEFKHRNILHGTTFYGQPIILLCLDNGLKLRFTHNFGEALDEEIISSFTVLRSEQQEA